MPIPSFRTITILIAAYCALNYGLACLAISTNSKYKNEIEFSLISFRKSLLLTATEMKDISVLLLKDVKHRRNPLPETFKENIPSY